MSPRRLAAILQMFLISNCYLLTTPKTFYVVLESFSL